MIASANVPARETKALGTLGAESLYRVGLVRGSSLILGPNGHQKRFEPTCRAVA